MNLLDWFFSLFKKGKKTKPFYKEVYTPVPMHLQSPPSKSSRKLEAADSKLQTAFRLIREHFRHKFPGMTLKLTDVYRSTNKQQKLFKQGRSTPGKIVTNIDGITKKGKHNHYPSKAIDVMVLHCSNNVGTWDMKYYRGMPRLAEKVSKEVGYKITNGGVWKKLRDYPHFEIK